MTGFLLADPEALQECGRPLLPLIYQELQLHGVRFAHLHKCRYGYITERLWLKILVVAFLFPPTSIIIYRNSL